MLFGLLKLYSENIGTAGKAFWSYVRDFEKLRDTEMYSLVELLMVLFILQDLLDWDTELGNFVELLTVLLILQDLLDLWCSQLDFFIVLHALLNHWGSINEGRVVLLLELCQNLSSDALAVRGNLRNNDLFFCKTLA